MEKLRKTAQKDHVSAMNNRKPGRTGYVRNEYLLTILHKYSFFEIMFFKKVLTDPPWRSGGERGVFRFVTEQILSGYYCKWVFSKFFLLSGLLY